MGQTCLIVTNDLIFGTRIAGAAKSAEWSCQRAATAAAAAAACLDSAEAGGPALAFVDVEALGAAAPEAVRAIKEKNPAIRVVAFYSHVNAAAGEAVRNAGADTVLPRSQFVQSLPQFFTGAA